jgi:hypothetical protein
VLARGGAAGGRGRGEDDPVTRLAPPVAADPSARRRPPRPLRPALLHGDRDWTIYAECYPDYVVLYPSRRRFPVESLSHSPAHNPFYQAVTQMIRRRQAGVPPGEAPFRPQVLFLVRPDSVRTYHAAYPALDTLPVPKKVHNLQPEDDVSAITAGP